MALCLLAAGGVSAQRCLPGMRGIALRGGTADGAAGSFYGGVAVETFARNSNKWVVGAEYLERRFDYDTGPIPVEQFTAEVGYYKYLWADPSRTVYLSLGGSALAGYEALNRGERTLPDGAMLTGKDGAVFGLAATLQLESYLTDRIVIGIHARQRALWGSNVGNGRFQTGISIKFMFN